MIKVYYCEKCKNIFYLSKSGNCKKCNDKLIDTKYNYNTYVLLDKHKREEVIKNAQKENRE